MRNKCSLEVAVKKAAIWGRKARTRLSTPNCGGQPWQFPETRNKFSKQLPKFIPWIIIGLFFAGYLVVGLKIYRNYGLSWDELYERRLGIQAGEYILGINQDLLVSNDRYYGQFFNMVKILIEQISGAQGFPEVIFVGHLINFLLFYSAVFVFFLLGSKRSGSWQMGLLGSAFLVFSPVIFSHSFYNPKDIPFMGFVIMAMFTHSLFEDRPTYGRAALHAAFSAAAIGSRILGVIAPVITLGVLFLRQIAAPREERLSWRKMMALAAIYLVLTAAGTVLLYPVFWTDPLGQFVQAFKTFQLYNEWNSSMVFMGRVITQENIPWYYLPVWIGISTPPLYLALFGIGTAFSVRRLFDHRQAGFDRQKRDSLQNLVWVFGSLLVIILGRSIVYDGWRHVFFIYPAFLLIAVDGLMELVAWLRMRWNLRGAWVMCGIAVVVSCGFTATHIIRTHPLEHIYMNRMAGPNLASALGRYELDYWGLTFRPALEFIHQSDSQEHIRVTTSSRGGEFNELIISQEANLHLGFVEDVQYADYYVTNVPNDRPAGDLVREVYAVEVNGVKIAVVYRMH